jgi:hypothetical protein
MLDAVLIGVPKSGSTTLADWLQAHPGVAMARIKEPNFYAAELDPQTFSEAFLRVSPDAGADYWGQPDPLPQRHQAFVRRPEDYARLWSHAQPGQLRVEASTSYFWSPTAAQALPAANPSVTAVVVLRNPVDRAFSHYRMARKYGLVSGSFLDELAADAARPALWGQSENFVALSRYADAYRRWSASGIRLHTFMYEQAFAEPEVFWSEVQSALGLEAIPLPHAEKVHAAHDVRWPQLVHFAQHHPVGRWLKDRLPVGLQQRAKSATVASEPIRLDPQDRATAWAYFADDVAELEVLLGKNLSLWT